MKVVRPGGCRPTGRPDIRSASSLAIARPRPEPWASSAVKNGSKIALAFARRDPRPPSSRTASGRSPLSRCAPRRDVGARRRVGERVVDQDRARSGPRAPGSHVASIGSPGRRSSSASRAGRARLELAGDQRGTARRGRPARGAARASRPPAATGRAGRPTACAVASTCSRTCARNRRRVSASSSSSSSSSTKPPSEKIGVRSSCEAVAMNFLRARRAGAAGAACR